MAPLALPGELVRIATVNEKAQMVRAKVEEVLEPSPERVAPRCPHYGACGGCQYQHAGYEFQVAQKREIVRDVLRRVGRIEWTADIPAITADPWAYRNRIQLHFDERKMGFHAAGSHTLEAIRSCDVASLRLQEAIATLREMKRSPRWPRFVKSIELFTNEEQTQVNVLDSGSQRINRGFFEWCEAQPALAGAFAPALDYAVGDGKHRFRVSHKSFFQVNRFLVDKLAEVAIDGAQGGGRIALDLYAGVGLFSLPLAAEKGFAQVTAVEAVNSASADLAFNAERHGLQDKIRAVKSRTEDYLDSEAVASGPRPAFVIADPPRVGLGKQVVDGLRRLGAQRLHIVSCDPPTLARDLAGLTAAGDDGAYRLESVTMVDLFPQTSHIEVVAKLVRD